MPRTDTAAERPPVEASSASEDNAGDDRSRPTRVQHPPANGGRSFLEGLFERLRPRMPRLVREDLTKALRAHIAAPDPTMLVVRTRLAAPPTDQHRWYRQQAWRQ